MNKTTAAEQEILRTFESFRSRWSNIERLETSLGKSGRLWVSCFGRERGAQVRMPFSGRPTHLKAFRFLLAADKALGIFR